MLLHDLNLQIMGLICVSCENRITNLLLKNSYYNHCDIMNFEFILKNLTK